MGIGDSRGWLADSAATVQNNTLSILHLTADGAMGIAAIVHMFV